MKADSFTPTNGLDFTKSVACQPENEWCTYQEPHSHGSFACDATCPCRRRPGWTD